MWVDFGVREQEMDFFTCGLLWCFYQLFGLSFWRHPFTAEDPLVSEWCNAKFLQICSHKETNASTSWTAWGWVNCQQIFIFGWTIPLRCRNAFKKITQIQSYWKTEQKKEFETNTVKTLLHTQISRWSCMHWTPAVQCIFSGVKKSSPGENTQVLITINDNTVFNLKSEDTGDHTCVLTLYVAN